MFLGVLQLNPYHDQETKKQVSFKFNIALKIDGKVKIDIGGGGNTLKLF